MDLSNKLVQCEARVPIQIIKNPLINSNQDFYVYFRGIF